MATINDVASRAGVSVALVSRVLNGDASVRARPETRERVLRAAQELSYRPNRSARALRLAQSGAIALIVPDITSPVFSALLHGVDDAAGVADYVVLLGQSEFLMPGSEALRRLVDESRVDGYLIQYADDPAIHPLSVVIERRAPVVVVNSWQIPDCSSAVLDDVAGARVATEHLLELGHRRIGMISGAEETATALRRESGFRTAMRAAGAPVPRGWIRRCGYQPENGVSGMRQLMSLKSRPTGVFVANVNAALGALEEARTLGIDVPGEVSIVALQDMWFAAHTHPALTCVAMPQYELGYEAVNLLRRRMSGGPLEDVIVDDPPPLLVRRNSAAPPSN